MSRTGLPTTGLPPSYQLVVVKSTTSQPCWSTQHANIASSYHIQPSSLTSHDVTCGDQLVSSCPDDVTGCERRVCRPPGSSTVTQQQWNNSGPRVDYWNSKQRLASCLWIGRAIKTQQQQTTTTLSSSVRLLTENQVQVKQLCKNLVERCEKCCDVITDELLRAVGKSFHPHCFICSVCNTCLDGTAFTVDIHSQVYCIPDYIRRYAPKCSACQLPVTPYKGSNQTQRVVALDRTFHQMCFRCQLCGVVLTNSSCYSLQDCVLCLSCNIQQQQQQQQWRQQRQPIASSSSSSTTTITTGLFTEQQTINCLVACSSDDTTPHHVDIPYHVDITVDDDAVSCSSYNSTTCDDVTLCSSDRSFDDVSGTTNCDVISCVNDVIQQHCACSVDSGHCSGTSDDTLTSSDSDTVDAEFSINNDSVQELNDTLTNSSKLTQATINNTYSIRFQLLVKHLNCSDLERVTDL